MKVSLKEVGLKQNEISRILDNDAVKNILKQEIRYESLFEDIKIRMFKELKEVDCEVKVGIAESLEDDDYQVELVIAKRMNDHSDDYSVIFRTKISFVMGLCDIKITKNKCCIVSIESVQPQQVRELCDELSEILDCSLF